MRKNRSVRVVQRRLRREKRQKFRLLAEGIYTIQSQLARLGYKEPSSDHISRLHISEKNLRSLMEFSYSTIAELTQSALTRGGIFKARREWEKSESSDHLMTEVLEALTSYYRSQLALLRELKNKLGQG